MTWLFPEPDLNPGELVEWKTKAQLMPESGRQTTGMLFLTNEHVTFVPGRGTPRQRSSITQLSRRTGISVENGAGRFGYGPGSGAWKPLRLTSEDGRSVTFAVRHLDDTRAFLQRALSSARA